MKNHKKIEKNKQKNKEKIKENEPKSEFLKDEIVLKNRKIDYISFLKEKQFTRSILPETNILMRRFWIDLALFLGVGLVLVIIQIILHNSLLFIAAIFSLCALYLVYFFVYFYPKFKKIRKLENTITFSMYDYEKLKDFNYTKIFYDFSNSIAFKVTERGLRTASLNEIYSGNVIENDTRDELNDLPDVTISYEDLNLIATPVFRKKGEAVTLYLHSQMKKSLVEKINAEVAEFLYRQNSNNLVKHYAELNEEEKQDMAEHFADYFKKKYKNSSAPYGEISVSGELKELIKNEKFLKRNLYFELDVGLYNELKKYNVKIENLENARAEINKKRAEILGKDIREQVKFNNI